MTANESVSFERWVQRVEDTAIANHDRLMRRIDTLDGKIGKNNDRMMERLDILDGKIDTQSNRVTELEVKAEMKPLITGTVGGMVGIIAAVAVAVWQALSPTKP